MEIRRPKMKCKNNFKLQSNNKTQKKGQNNIIFVQHYVVSDRLGTATVKYVL